MAYLILTTHVKLNKTITSNTIQIHVDFNLPVVLYTHEGHALALC